MNFYKVFFKPVFDVFAALILLILLSPIILLIIIVLGIANNGSVFFIQTRPGYKAKLFQIIKFKTMSDTRDSNGHLLPDHERLTKIGKFVRATSLDEILQLINVLKGDMSFVGPRPLLVKYLKKYNKLQARRHDVKPGITGLAQVKGRNLISWEEKFRLDIEYVNNQSFFLDLKILFLTIYNVIFSRGVKPDGKETMDEFKGSK